MIKLFWDQRQGGPGGFANAQSKVASAASHGNGDVPASCGSGIGHQTLDNFHAVVAGRLVAKRADLWWEIEVVVDGFWNVRHTDASTGCLLHVHRTKRSVVSTNGDQFVDPLGFQRVDDPLQILWVFGGVGSARPQHGTATKVQATDVGDVHGLQGIKIAFHHPREAVTDAVHLRPRQAGPDHCRGNDTIDSRGRTTTNNNRKSSGHGKTAFRIRGGSLPRVRCGSKVPQAEAAIFWPVSQVDP